MPAPLQELLSDELKVELGAGLHHEVEIRHSGPGVDVVAIRGESQVEIEVELDAVPLEHPAANRILVVFEQPQEATPVYRYRQRDDVDLHFLGCWIRWSITPERGDAPFPQRAWILLVSVDRRVFRRRGSGEQQEGREQRQRAGHACEHSISA